MIKQGRSGLKRYGVVLARINTRTEHIEVALVARRGQVSELGFDYGTNFVEAKHEPANAIENSNKTQINYFLLQRNIKWKFSVPRASHHGGIWGWLIRSVRKIFFALCTEQAITDESLLTL